MKTKAYIKTFDLNNNQSEANLQKFLKEFKREFNEKLEITLEARKNMQLDCPFSIFLNVVKEMNQKFDSISAHITGSLPPKLWNQFYATSVIQAREKFYPKEHAEINARRLQKLAGLENKE